LVDEIDKAPRDFPNDLLNEIDGMYFKVPELGTGAKKIEAREDLRPVVVITSNSEKGLPDAFLRRCVFYDIPFPDRNQLLEIVFSHIGSFRSSRPIWLADALDLFHRLREPTLGFDKRPATAELLNWVTYLRRVSRERELALRRESGLVASSLSILLKTESDKRRAKETLAEWFREPSR
jgi:MoxR-like ATPase